MIARGADGPDLVSATPLPSWTLRASACGADFRQALLINMASVPKASKDEDSKEQQDEEKGKGCRLEARHAIAKTLVTTNPNLLTEAQNMG